MGTAAGAGPDRPVAMAAARERDLDAAKPKATRGRDERDPGPARRRPEPLARLHHPRRGQRRHDRGLRPRPLADRPDLEPDDLRPGAGRGRRLRRADLRAARGRQERGGPLLRARDPRPARSLRPVRRDPRADQRRRRLGVARGLAAARPRHRGDGRGGGAAPRRRPTATTSSSRSRARPEGLAAIEETIYAGIPVNVTLLFDADQYVAQAEAYMRGIERRVADGLDPNVGSVASLFVSRWDVADRRRGRSTSSRTGSGSPPRSTATSPTAALLESDRWLRLAERGRPPAALPLRLDRDQGPVAAEDDLRARPSPRRSRSTRCPRTRCSRCTRRATSVDVDPRRRRRQRRRAGRVRARPAST